MPPERLSLIQRAGHMIDYRRQLRVSYGDVTELPPEPVDYSMLNKLTDKELRNIINGAYA
jgi:hypothetical protein